MKKIIVSAIILVLLVSCGGLSHPTLEDAKLHVRGKRYEKAYNSLSNVLYNGSGKKTNELRAIPEAWLEMAKLHKRKDENEKALAALNKVEELDKTGEFKTQSENLKKFYSGTDFNNAVKHFNEGIKADGEARKKSLNTAKSLLNSSAIFDQNAQTYSILAKAEEQLGELENAEKHHKKAVSLEPENKDHVFELASFYYNNKMYDKAIVEFNKTLKMDPQHRSALKFKAFSYQNDQKIEQAVESYKALLATYPDDQDGLTNLKSVESIHVIMQANDYIAKFNKVRNSNKKQAKEYLTKCATLVEKAVGSDMHKENGDLWATLSIVYANLGNAKKAKHADEMSKKYASN